MPAIDAKEALKDSVCFRIRLKCVPLSILSINRPPVSGNTITKIDPDMSMSCHGPKNVTPAENQGEGNQISQLACSQISQLDAFL